MKFNNIAITVTVMTSLLSCGDFKQKNLTSGEPVKSQESLESENLNSETVNEGSFTKKKMLYNIGVNIAAPAIVDFHDHLKQLEESTATYCSVVATETDDQSVLSILKEKAQVHWEVAISKYHYLEAFKFGPLADTNNSGQRPLEIYSWPDEINACRVDIEVYKYSKKAQTYTLRSANNSKGLDALGALLFTEDDKHNCPSERYLRSWPKKPTAQKRADRCGYMKLVIKDLLKNTSELVSLWNKNEGNYIEQLTLESVEIDNINMVSNALFFVESVVKDIKLGRPSGIQGCNKTSCPNQAEHPTHKNMSIEALIQNMNGFSNVFNGITLEGVNGKGLDDYLTKLGHKEISDDVNNVLTKIQKRLSMISKETSIKVLATGIDENQCLESTTDDRKVEICSLYKNVKELTDILKTKFVLALGEGSIPRQSQGDMD